MTDSFGSGFAGQVKQEERDIKDVPMARWEDVGRIRAQTFNMAGLRAWQITALLFTAMSWAYTISAYRSAEVIPSNDLTAIVNAAIILASLVIFAFIVIDIRREVVDGGAQWVVIGVAFVVEVGAVFLIAPVATWALMNMFLIGYAPILQIVAAGWIPVALSIVSLSIVPDFQIGRFAWWRELTNQPAASSEKQVEDVTAIRLKQMELDAKHDEMTDSERAEYEDRIAELEDKIASLVSTKPVTRLVPLNHGSARSVNGAEFTEQEWADLREFVAGWAKRGFSRDAWCTDAAERKHGSRIPEPSWYKFRDVLRGLRIYDASNRPIVSAEDAASALGFEL